MEVILDDEPLGERIDRPRSHTWPLLPPPEIVDQTRREKADTPEPQQPISSEISESRKSDGASPRKNSRKNAWGNLSYADLITQAIESSPEKRLTLAQVYDWMVKNVHYFKDKGDSTSSAGWKNSIRHNLSLHSRFMRVQNDQNGKSSYWVINPDAKPGKASRRRSGSIDGAPKQERKRGHKSKKNNSEDGCNISPSSSGTISRHGSKQNLSVESPGNVITMSPCSSTDSLSGLPDLEENGNFIFTSDSFTRPRSTSNVSTQSSVGGRLTPIPGDEAEEEIQSPYNHYDGSQGEPLDLPVTRPRGSSGADETAHLLESVNIGRTHETINLDDSLKFETTMGGGGYTVTETGIHSESFSSVQSVDSGYDSSPVSTYYTHSSISPTQQQPRPYASVHNHNMMPVPSKPPPPPYNPQQFTPVRQAQQPQPHMIQRQQLPMCNPQAGQPIHPDMHTQNYYPSVPSHGHMVNPRGYVSSQPTQRLQHLPQTNIYRKGPGSIFRRGMNTISDPYLPSVTSANIKDVRNMTGMARNSYVPSLSALPMEQDSVTNDIFPSDLSHVPLHDFNDQFQLARDLESIIRSELGEGNMQIDFLEQQAPNSYVSSGSTVNLPGQSWVH